MWNEENNNCHYKNGFGIDGRDGKKVKIAGVREYTRGSEIEVSRWIS